MPIVTPQTLRPLTRVLVARCFKAGDVRVNEHVGLATLHTLWVREHNRMAAALQHLNSHWGDETLFQEARRVVAAEMQHITYAEFLPVVLGQVCNWKHYTIYIPVSE
jgi:hypothetical protein